MNRNGYTYGVARIKKSLTPIDAETADVIAEAVDTSGFTRRQLSELTGMSVNRIGIIIRKEPPPATIGELGAIAHALGKSASEIVRLAEGRLSDVATVTAIEAVRAGKRHDAPPFEVHEELGAAYDQTDGEVSDPEEP